MLDRFSPAAYTEGPYNALVAYVASGAAWTGSDAQVNLKVPSVARLILGSAEYQFV